MPMCAADLAQLAFSECAESNAGPFTVTAQMRSLDDDTSFPLGVGKARPRRPAHRQRALIAMMPFAAHSTASF